jgi:hypothetical protein
MVVITPALALGAAQAGMGIFQSITGNKAQKQDYLNQAAFQKANNEFASWQAGLNAKLTDTNAQYKYWADTVNHNQQLAYTGSLRNVELLKAVRQAETVASTRAAAGAGYAQDSEAISQAFAESSMQEAVALQQYQWRSLQGQASVQAMGQEGNSVDRLVNDYARQLGDYETLQTINQGIRSRQYTREQAGQVSQYLSRWQSQSFYDQQQFMDPIAPFAPLPTMIQPAGPSMTGAGPSSGALGLNIGTAIMGGVSTGLSMQSQMKGLSTPSSSTGSGTGGGN